MQIQPRCLVHSPAFGDSNLTRGKKKRQKRKYCKNGQECKRNGGQTGMRRKESRHWAEKKTGKGRNRQSKERMRKWDRKRDTVQRSTVKVAGWMSEIERESEKQYGGQMNKRVRTEEDERWEGKMLAVCRFLLHHVLKREKQGMQGRDKRKLIKEAQPKKRCPVFSILLAVWRLIFMP